MKNKADEKKLEDERLPPIEQLPELESNKVSRHTIRGSVRKQTNMKWKLSEELLLNLEEKDLPFAIGQDVDVEDYDAFDDEEYKGFKFEWLPNKEGSTKGFVYIIEMPDEYHDEAVRFIDSEIRDYIYINGLRHEIINCGSSYMFRRPRMEPDGSFRRRNSNRPFIVVEVANTQSLDDLKERVRRMVRRSRGSLEYVIILDIDKEEQTLQIFFYNVRTESFVACEDGILFIEGVAELSGISLLKFKWLAKNLELIKWISIILSLVFGLYFGFVLTEILISIPFFVLTVVLFKKPLTRLVPCAIDFNELLLDGLFEEYEII